MRALSSFSRLYIVVIANHYSTLFHFVSAPNSHGHLQQNRMPLNSGGPLLWSWCKPPLSLSLEYLDKGNATRAWTKRVHAWH